MAGAKVKIGVGLAACLAVLFQVSSAATSHVVGDSTGWTIPSTTSFYSSWASKQTFLVGDFLVFVFASGAHTVAEVSKADYDSCSSTSPIALLNNGPANLTISSPGTHYYICTFSGHCSAGQKLSITASAAPSTSPPTSSPAPKSSTSAPPPKSTAAPTPKSASSPTASPPTKSTAAPTPKSTASPTSSPAPKSSAAAPTPSGAAAPPPSSGAPTPTTSASSPSPASAPGPSGTGSPETAPTPSTSGGPASSPSPATGGSLSPPEPSLTPTKAPSSTPESDSPATGAGLVLPLVVVIGAIFLN